MLIDTHCHLTSPELVEHADDVLARARAAGVTRVILVAVNPADARAALRCWRDAPDLFLVAGVHPHEAGAVDLPTMWRRCGGAARRPALAD